jgi:hypothetical protein
MKRVQRQTWARVSSHRRRFRIGSLTPAATYIFSTASRRALLSALVFTMDEVARMFSWARVVGFNGTEACGCAVFYPEQRGTKMPFVD